MSLRVAIAGFGKVGQRRFHFLKKKKFFKIIAISDQYHKYREIFKSGNIYNDYKIMLKNEKIDVLFICLPNKDSARATTIALKKGCHVFCEKPPARNFQELLKVKKIFKTTKNQVLRYGFNHRYHDSVQYAKRLIDSKKLGKIINLNGVYGKSYLTPNIKENKKIKYHFGWRTRKRDAGGGILLDQGIHLVDLMNLFVGHFVQSKSYISKSFWKKDVEDNVYALLKNKKNIFAMIHSSATLWKHKFHLEISLTKGMIILSGILSGTKSYGKEKITIIRKSKNSLIPFEKVKNYKIDNSWNKEINSFISSIKKKSLNSICGIDDAITTMKTIKMIYKI